jgi:transcription-repair coupling factor (superfamily II helicase)
MERADLCGLLTVLHKLPGYSELLAGLRSSDGEAPEPLGLPEAARPFVVAGLFQDLERPLLVITPGEERAREYDAQLRAWCPDPGRVFHFPAPDPLPYQRAPWEPQTRAQRLGVLAMLYQYRAAGARHRTPFIVVTSARALLQRTLPFGDFLAETRLLHRGDWVAMGDLLDALYRLGYRPTPAVEQPGEFSHRGGIVDVFPPADERPVRIEFFGDEIESLRRFDPETQRSDELVDRALITPAHEALPLRGPQVARELEMLDLTTMHPLAQSEFRRYLEELAAGHAFPAIALFQPLLHPETATLLDYFPDHGLVIVDDWGRLDAVADQLAAQAERQRQEQIQAGEIPRGFEAMPYASWEHVRRQLEGRPRLVVGHAASMGESSRLAAHFAPSPRYGGQLQEVVADCVAQTEEGRAVVVVSRQAPRLAQLFEDWGIYLKPVQRLEATPKRGAIVLVHGALDEGWTLTPQPDDPKIPPFTLLSDGEIFGWRMPRRRREVQHRSDKAEAFFADVAEGDYVVHIEHGIAIYRGLTRLNLGESEREYLVLEYAKGDKLYVPTYQVDRVSRYVGIGDKPPTITRLGTADWERVKSRAKKAVEEIARELLELYAEREVTRGHAFSPDTSWQAALEAAFPHVETEDQIRAIEEIKRDMESDKPMDRLLVGDVGFGKTEVAIRAAFKAVMDGKQVAVLVPTTVLAQQHYHTFRQRLQPFPIIVEMLSRFRSLKEQKDVLARLEKGEIDIVIGTHRLLQRDVRFKDLGLLIVDEEHRFGVRDKERLKQLRKQIDVLSMTATPIPRTLHMSLTGVRDMSTIDTPPDERLPVVTQVVERDDELIRRAILRELSRGGQVFFVHNRVATIDHVAAQLRRLVPEATIAVAHGQMDEDELANAMLRFAAGEIDVLVCTSIIESGLDIPNANTLIVDRADTFGLAQLYQLRGRVGRSARRAYAYFLYDRYADLPEDARKRLQTLAEATELGAGFRIAMRDLEIRGAGDLLGPRQHGHISAVGFDLYTRLLAQAIKKLRADEQEKEKREKGKKTKREREALEGEVGLLPTVDLPIDAYLPEDYVTDEAVRLRLYRRMTEVTRLDEVAAMEQELRDRFGDLPEPAQNLIYVLRLRVLAAQAGVQFVACEGRTIVIRLEGAGPRQRAAILRRFDGRLRVGRDQIWLPIQGEDSRWRQDLERALEDLAVISNQ